MRLACSSVSATTTCRLTPIAVPPRNSGFGMAALPRFASASVNVSMFCFARGVGPLVRKCMPCSPAQVDPVALDEPYQNDGCGCGKGGICIGRLVYAE